MLVSIVLPAYNEAPVISDAIESVKAAFSDGDCLFEILVVDDGSSDSTPQILSAAATSDSRVKVITFTRNFGHQTAITAGLDFAMGDAVVIMDADLQDPPSVLTEMIEMYRLGYDVVLAQRITRTCDTMFKRFTASLFYWMMRHFVQDRLVSDVGDFRLLSRSAVGALRSFRERERFMRGIVAWLGLKQTIIGFHRERRHAGQTKYHLAKMLRFAWTAVVSSTGFPARSGIILGMVFLFVGTLWCCAEIVSLVTRGSQVIGSNWLISLHMAITGLSLIVIGVIGDYVSRIYDEVRGRPLYVVSQTQNIDLSRVRINGFIVLGHNISV